ncbi:DUF1707 SHOCT-like domain-containing protein [Pseudonocardia hierapolitana]|uniref:DUF1707 SHOCT-like domain-containing protein n=1 Tax=Pseudonocardia hierapolitana TaxID=1128676 RepID=UPI001FE441D3|nr:DUF1707 domain-containing protein [Pseudonocardia hierapolitana]
MSPDADRSRMRISDADRAATAERLRIALDEGRLDLSEYDDRVRSAYAATTYGELEPITADLPPVTVPAVAQPAAALEHRKWTNEWREWLGGAIIMIAIWGGTSLLSGSLHSFWPAIPLGIWAAVLVAGALGKKEKGA